MKLNSLILATTTSLELVGELDRKPTGVVISGYTPDSKEWRDAQQRIVGFSNKTTSVELGKKGRNRIQIPNDPDAHKKRIQLLAAVVTDIEGIEDFKYSAESVLDLFMNDGCSWMVEQWEDHMDKRSDFLAPRSKPARTGSKSSAG